MSIGLIFWILMIIWFVLGGIRMSGQSDPRFVMGGDILEFVLFFLLGWGVFGFVVHG